MVPYLKPYGLGPRISRCAMQHRRRYKPQTHSLEQRLQERASQFRERAKALSAGAERETLLKLARQAEAGARMSEWLRSPRLQPSERTTWKRPALTTSA